MTKEPITPVEEYKNTKILATIGPSTDTYEKIKELIEAGANGIRLNFSHGNHEERIEHIKWVRKASKELGKPVAIVQDLQGPKIRLGDFDDVITVQAGQELRFKHGAEWPKDGIIPIQYDLSQKVSRGQRLYLFDGKVRTSITNVKDGIVYARADNDGILLKRKGMNLPDTDFGGDVITEKDKADLAFGCTQDIDYVAMSFIHNASDIEQMRRLIKNHGVERKIIAKIETRFAIDHLDEIMQATDAAMVARGDMAVEVDLESVPVVQRRIINLGLKYAKPTIVATQMLGSMTDMPEPTRAEVSDVATAVFLGADAVMLSDETAMGKYPHDAVRVMKRIIKYAQTNNDLIGFNFVDDVPQGATRQVSISRAVIRLAESISARAIVAETRSGATVLNISSLRPDMPIIAVTDHTRTAQQLALVFGVKSFVRPASKTAANKLTDFLRTKRVFDKGDIIVAVSGQYPGVVGTTDTIKVRQLD
jgi:pyruvate kinase